MGQLLSDLFVGIATWLVNVAVLWVAVAVAAMGLTLICTMTGPFGSMKWRRDD